MEAPETPRRAPFQFRRKDFRHIADPVRPPGPNLPGRFASSALNRSAVERSISPPATQRSMSLFSETTDPNSAHPRIPHMGILRRHPASCSGEQANAAACNRQVADFACPASKCKPGLQSNVLHCERILVTLRKLWLPEYLAKTTCNWATRRRIASKCGACAAQ